MTTYETNEYTKIEALRIYSTHYFINLIVKKKYLTKLTLIKIFEKI